jgi:uncharacterized protein YdeI (YjbR/CyaY-like superfamily)
VKAEIRKKINKHAGDYVQVVLYADHEPTAIPKELLVCLLDEPEAHRNFLRYTDGERKAYIDWINAAKTTNTKVNRIAATITKVLKGQKHFNNI